MSEHHRDAPTTRIPVVVPPSPEETTAPIGTSATAEAPQRPPTIMEQMGGIPGMISSTVPVAVFVVVNVITELSTALWAALGAGVLVMVWRLVRRDKLQPAISGLVGVGICALVARQTGEARGFYLPGLIYSGVLGVAALVSMVARWPLAGVIWHGINGHGMQWRRQPALVRAYTLATGIWAAVFLVRVAVQGLLYDANAETALGITRIAMGYPLMAVAILASVLIVRRTERARPAF